MKGKRIIKCPSPFLLDAFQRFEKETHKKEIRLGEFLEWLRRKGSFEKGGGR
jgi:hypothetical protein